LLHDKKDEVFSKDEVARGIMRYLKFKTYGRDWEKSAKKTPGTKFSSILNLLLFEQNFSLGREWSKGTYSLLYF
jgi:hypothetical protein